jgi:hypothetical protein
MVHDMQTACRFPSIPIFLDYLLHSTLEVFVQNTI